MLIGFRYGLPHEQVVALLSLTDVFLATSLNDGVTMSALTFIAAQNPDDEGDDEEEDQELIARRLRSNITDRDRDRSRSNRRGSRSTDTLDRVSKTTSGKGVLLYSEFAGCAKAMKGALILNPYDVAKVGTAIKTALNMGSKQRTIRYLQLLTYVNTFTALNWGERMMRSLAFSSVTSLKFRSNEVINLDGLAQDYRQSKKRLLIFSFAGVLTDPLTLPALSRPSESLILTLQRLAKDERNVVVLVDASSTATMQAWGCMRLARVLLVAGNGYCCTVVGDADAAAAEDKWRRVREKKLEEAEAATREMRERGGEVEKRWDTEERMKLHTPVTKRILEEEREAAKSEEGGYAAAAADVAATATDTTAADAAHRLLRQNIQRLSRVPEQQESSPWRLCGGVTDTLGRWRGELLSVLQHFKLRTPGSFLDDSGNAALIWYYTNADPEFGFRQAKDLHMHLDRMLQAWPLEAVFMRQRKCIVIGPVDSNIQRLSAFAMHMSHMVSEQKGGRTGGGGGGGGGGGEGGGGEGRGREEEQGDKKTEEGLVTAGGTALTYMQSRREVDEVGRNKMTTISRAMKDDDVMIVCACCDAISQRMLLPFTERRRGQAKTNRLYTLSIGTRISRARYHVDSHGSFLSILEGLE
jgi:trehalose-6-phosphatase